MYYVWGRILRGRTPFLSIEITKECPLRCPGCYAYSPEHLGPVTTLRQLSDFRGQELVNATLAVVRRIRPVHMSIIGGEPLVRYRELGELLPLLDRMGVEVQLVTSAVRPIPAEWSSIGALHVVVSVDGLPEEHDQRRAPATYERILKHIARHRIAVHCTVTRQCWRGPGTWPISAGSGRCGRKSIVSGTASILRRRAMIRGSGCGRPIAKFFSRS